MDVSDHGRELTRYADWAPTGFDAKGLHERDLNGNGDRSDWRVLPVSRTRDSDPAEDSNFTAALELLGGEGDHVEVHRFGHWGPGWIEIILVDPEDDRAIEAAGEIACRLEDYPLLDEDDCSRREYEAAIEQIEDQAGRWVKADPPADWAAQVYRALEDRSIDAMRNPGGGGPDDQEYRAVLRRWKLSEPRFIHPRRLLRRFRRPGIVAWQWANLRIRERNPEYCD